MPLHTVIEVRVHKPALSYENLAVDHRVARPAHRAPDDGLDRIEHCPCRRQARQRVARQVGTLAEAQRADVTPSEAAGSSGGGHGEHISGLQARRSVAQMGEKQCLADLTPQVARVVSRRAVTSEPDVHTGTAHLAGRAQSGADDHVRGRTVGHRRAGGREPSDLVGVGPHRVSEPRASGEPAQLAGELVRAHTENLCAESGLVARLREVGVQTHVQAFGKIGRTTHQLWGDRERGTRAERDLKHRPRCRVVKAFDQPLAVSQDLVLVLDHRHRRQPAVIGAERHRSPRGMEADP